MIKCVVWDLDNTVWDGVLLEDDRVRLRPDVRDMIVDLDRRGIVQSVASRGDRDLALAQLAHVGLLEYLVVPQVGWDDKSTLLGYIAEELNLSVDSLAFIDDDPFERAEVAARHPAVVCFADDVVTRYRTEAAFAATALSTEGRQRRLLYQADERRKAAEQRSGLSRPEFLAALDLRFHARPATTADIRRCHELTVRTHQLNTTGVVYSEQDLTALVGSAGHLVLVAGLADRYGSYGTIGLAVVELAPDRWTLKLLLTSCRVISRGAGTLLLRDVMRRAFDAQVDLYAELVPTDRNRMMLIALRFNGFTTTADPAAAGRPTTFRVRPQARPTLPPYVREGSLA